jgi:hypothetical protein
MTIGELAAIMPTMNPSHNAFVALFTADGTAELFEIDAAKAAADAFLDFCARRGMTEEEKDLIWNVRVFLCYEQVQNRTGDCGWMSGYNTPWHATAPSTSPLAAGKPETSTASRSGSTKSMDTYTSRGVQAAGIGMPTCWRIPSSRFISSRAPKPTYPPEPRPFGIPPDAEFRRTCREEDQIRTWGLNHTMTDTR